MQHRKVQKLYHLRMSDLDKDLPTMGAGAVNDFQQALLPLNTLKEWVEWAARSTALNAACMRAMWSKLSGRAHMI